jgi:glutamate racemase
MFRQIQPDTKNPRSRLAAVSKPSRQADGESTSRPIGVFDSGIGGLTVVKALRELLPDENIIYLGDTARVPYGSKSPATVERYSLEIADMLMQQNAKAIVVACNTASSVALPKLERAVPVAVIGVIRPGAEAAVAATRTGHVGVIGTRATIKSGAYEKTLRELDARIRVTSLACPLLVPLIEEGLLEDTVTDQVLARYLEPLLQNGIDTLVLGCTHYPLLSPAIERALGGKVQLVDSARNCAAAVERLLESKSLRAPATGAGSLRVSLTDAPDNFLRVAKQALQLEIGDIEICELSHKTSAL